MSGCLIALALGWSNWKVFFPLLNNSSSSQLGGVNLVRLFVPYFFFFVQITAQVFVQFPIRFPRNNPRFMQVPSEIIILVLDRVSSVFGKESYGLNSQKGLVELKAKLVRNPLFPLGIHA